MRMKRVISMMTGIVVILYHDDNDNGENSHGDSKRMNPEDLGWVWRTL